MSEQILDMVVQFAALIVCAVCVVLVLHPKYNDGLVGRIGLAMMGIAAFSSAATMISNFNPPVSNIGAVLWIGLALFMARHFRNFYLRKDLPDADKVSK